MPPRPYPNRRRRRSRRPPRRYPDAHAPPPAPSGFTPGGLGRAYDLFMPTLQGREKREWFNSLCRSLLVSSGLAGAAIGYACAGPLGAVLGFGGGLMAGGSFSEKQRFYRR